MAGVRGSGSGNRATRRMSPKRLVQSQVPPGWDCEKPLPLLRRMVVRWCSTLARRPPAVRRPCSRARRPARRVGSSSRTSGCDPGDDDPSDPEPPPEPRYQRVAPTPAVALYARDREPIAGVSIRRSGGRR
jgi:hypothetical protein